MLESLAREKHSSLSQKSVNYGRKKFYNIGPWCLGHKTFLFDKKAAQDKLECLSIERFFSLVICDQKQRPHSENILRTSYNQCFG
jgi:hypothetical protein